MSRSPVSLRNVIRLMQGRAPGQLIIQMTDKCNARCPQCEMRVTESFKRTTLSVDDMRRIIDAAAARGIQALSFTGGEPMLMLDEMVPLIHHAHKAGIPLIRTGTNGYLFKNPEAPGWESRIQRLADTLAETPLRNFWISIDSAVPEVHERMRGFPNLIAGIERALPHFHSRGLYPSANLGVNRNVGGGATWDLYPEQFPDEPTYLDAFHDAMTLSLRRFYRRVRDMGFTMVNTCYPMSIDQPEQQIGLNAVYAATSLDRVIRFTRGERAMLFRALMDTVPAFRHELRIFSPRSSLLALYRQYASDEQEKRAAYGCRGGIDFFFVNSVDGNTYPCGYRGHDNMGKFWDLDTNAIPAQSACTDCDWECFRDPSEIVGPMLEAFSKPLSLASRWKADPQFYKLWLEDLRYYRACNYFDGRTPPNFAQLQHFFRYFDETPTRPAAAQAA